jgi:hypothetical protein
LRRILPLLLRSVVWWLPLLPSSSGAVFVERAATLGVDSTVCMTYAAGFVDFDGDWDTDLYVGRHWRDPSILYRNDGSGMMTDVSQHYGVGYSDRHDARWADLDGDGLPDQYIIHGAGGGTGFQENELFWNEGNGVFMDGAVAAGVGDGYGRGRELGVADFDRNGFLDFFVGNDYRPGSTRPNRLFWNLGNRLFSTDPGGGDLFMARNHVSAVDYNGDFWPDLMLTNPHAQPGELYRNEAGSGWTNITATAFPNEPEALGMAQGMAWGDMDNDGDLDLFVSAGVRGMWDFVGLEADSVRWYLECEIGETKRVDAVVVADSVTIRAVASDFHPLTFHVGALGLVPPDFPATFAIADIVGEPVDPGEGGLFLWSDPGASSDTVRVRLSGGSAKGLLAGGSLRFPGGAILSVTADSLSPPPPYAFASWQNGLFENRGDGTFAESKSGFRDLDNPSWNTMGAAWVDYDNDGWLDLYLCNGGTIETGNQPNVLLRNTNGTSFLDVTTAEGVAGSTVGMTDGACWGDVDGDGDPDLFVTHGAEHPPDGVGPRELFLNEGTRGNWVVLRPRGMVSNVTGVGSVFRVVTGGREIWRTLLGESENGFHSTPEVRVGLGVETVCDTVECFWPSGVVDRWTAVSGNASYLAIEGGELRAAGPPSLEITPAVIADTLVAREFRSYGVDLANTGAAAADFSVSIEDCTGGAVSWVTVSPSASAVWPAGTRSVVLSADASFATAGDYCLRAVFASSDPAGPDTLDISLTVNEPETGVSLSEGAPVRFALGRPLPNPSRAGVRMELALPQAGEVDVAVLDLQGRRVATLARGRRPAGRSTLVWTPGKGDLRPAPGVFFVRASWKGLTSSRKVVLIP